LNSKSSGTQLRAERTVTTNDGTWPEAEWLLRSDRERIADVG
jgi:hypothetical protein